MGVPCCAWMDAADLRVRGWGWEMISGVCGGCGWGLADDGEAGGGCGFGGGDFDEVDAGGVVLEVEGGGRGCEGLGMEGLAEGVDDLELGFGEGCGALDGDGVGGWVGEEGDLLLGVLGRGDGDWAGVFEEVKATSEGAT